MSIRSVCLIANANKPEALSLASELYAFLAARSVTALCEARAGRALGLPSAPDEALSLCDLCIVLGGDGTLIHSAHVLDGRPVPILGINLGSLGFLTEIPSADTFEMLERVLAGDYQTVARSKLKARLLRGPKEEQQLVAEVLNDVVINKGALARIADLEAHVDGLFLTTWRADGVIVSTPTGSTAYSLSANGPILHPSVDAVMVTPICPHTLTQRPVVLSGDRKIRIVLQSDTSEMYLTLDGQTGVPLFPKDAIEIERSPNKLLLIANPKVDYFSILRAKLKWGAR